MNYDPKVNCHGFIEKMTDILGDPDEIENADAYFSMKWWMHNDETMYWIEATYFISGLVGVKSGWFDIPMEKAEDIAQVFDKECKALGLNIKGK